MTSNIVSVGMVGSSWWADAMHLPALASHPCANTVAICGRNRDNAQKMADIWDIPQVYTDYRDMIDHADLDALIISTPNDSHYPITMKAFEKGLHVLCEKPIALTYAQAREMAEAAEAKQLKTLVPFTYSFMPTARYLKELIDGGYLGTPYHLNLRYYTGYARAGEYRWRFDRKIAGAGVAGDLGSHFLYLAEWFYGDISAITCRLGFSVPRPPTDPAGNAYEITDDSCMLTVEFASGAFGMIHCTAVCYEDSPFGQTHHMEFHGSDGTLYSFTDWDTIQQVKGAHGGGPDSGFCIYSGIDAETLPQAVAFLEYLSRPEIADMHLGIMEPLATSIKGVSVIESDVADDLRANHFPNTVRFLDWIWPTEINDAFQGAIQGIVGGTITAEEGMAQIQAVYDDLVADGYSYDD